jgi:hypothetical protein
MMSGWIRAGEGQLWHRVSPIEYSDAMDRGEYRLVCGERLPTAAGWQDSMDDLIGPDDQHGPCRDRALREAFWIGRIPGGDLAAITRALALEIRPDLRSVSIGPIRTREGVWVFELRAANLSGVVAGGGGQPKAAVGELLAALEARPR